MRRSTRALLAGALAALLGVATGEARGAYRVVDLGALLNTPTGKSSSVGAVNASGQATLTNAPDGAAYRAFRYSDGSALDLGTLGGSDSYAAGINNAGQVAGRSITTAGVLHAYIWTPGGTGGVASNPQMKDLNPSGEVSEATAINASGQAVGSVTVSRGPLPASARAFRYSNGSLTQLPLPVGGFSDSFAYGINDQGKVVGEAYIALSPMAHGFLYNGSSSVEIGDLGGGSSSPLAINNNDRVVGYSSSAEGYDHAFIFADGAMSDIGTLGGHYSYAKAINNNNQIVGGSFIDAEDVVYHAFVSDGTSMVDLNSQLTSKAVNWVLAEATGINDAGIVVGTGTLSGALHGFMLKPLAPGDANADGQVTFADFQAIELNFGNSGGWTEGDFNGDGIVDTDDFKLFLDQYNMTSAASDGAVVEAFAAAVGVPEPGGLALLLGAGVCALRRRR